MLITHNREAYITYLTEDPHLPVCTTVAASAVLENVDVGSGVFVGYNVVVRTGCKIGDNVVIGHNTVVEENVVIEDGARIQACCYLTKNMYVGKNVFIGPSFSCANDKEILSHGRGDPVLAGPVIDEGARIGAQVLILPGVHVGKEAFIGAGAIVTKDVPDGEVWYQKMSRACYQADVPEGELIGV